ncbi:hypothetical protein NL676_039703 [Syzygium grande]|nr:hypothetical protein NL676_039703 [Syzygium grande]
MEIECSSAFNVPPNNIVVDILARVAANSMDDFFNAKISCKIFNKLAEEDYIYQQISIDKIPDIMWRHAEEGNAFIERCIKCDNLEALYMEGLKKYISLGKVELGMELLKRAAQIGHFGASYAVGLLLVGEGGKLLEEGARLLRQVYAKRASGGMSQEVSPRRAQHLVEICIVLRKRASSLLLPNGDQGPQEERMGVRHRPLRRHRMRTMHLPSGNRDPLRVSQTAVIARFHYLVHDTLTCRRRQKV